MSEKQGTIVQVMGPVVDVAFDGGALPELKEALEVELDGRREVMEVAQHVKMIFPARDNMPKVFSLSLTVFRLLGTRERS